jgi:predicted Zn finger-like uncharacterized protein
MPLRASCPNCSAVLNIPDGAAGRAVECTVCRTTFSAPTTAARPVLEATAVTRKRDDERPSRKRQRPEVKPSVLPYVLVGGGIGLVVLLGVGFGIYQRTSAHADPSGKNDASAEPSPVSIAVSGQRFTILSAHRSMLAIEVEFNVEGNPGPPYDLVVELGGESFQYRLTAHDTTPGRHRVPLTLTAFGSRGNQPGAKLEVWIEERLVDAFDPGGRIASNKVTVD